MPKIWLTGPRRSDQQTWHAVFRQNFDARIQSLFTSKKNHRTAIHLALREMVEHISCGIVYPNRTSKEDHEGAVFEFALELVPKVKTTSPHIAEWFRKSLLRKFWERIRAEQRQATVLSNVPQDRFSKEPRKPEPVDPAAPIRRKRKSYLPPASPVEIRAMRHFFDTRIARTIKTIQEMESNPPPDDAAGSLIQRAYGMLDALQEGRFYTLREFKACSLKLVRFTPTQRLTVES